MKCVIEVGANSGSNTIELKANYPYTTVHGFEPTRQLLTQYLWIDAQGHDFTCLKSLRKKVLIVKKGKCEASLNVELYSKKANRAENIKKWLEDLGFSTKVVPDKSGVDAEYDVHFWR